MGASSGLGFEVAKILLDDGWQIGVAARRSDLLMQLAAINPERVKAETIDVTEADADDRLMRLVDSVGGMDLYFHASGFGHLNKELDADIEMSTVATNADGFVRMVGAAFRYMAAHGGGHIAAISSVAGTKGLGAAPAYSATKSFQSTYLQALEQLSHMRGLGIIVTDFRPGFVDTAFLGGCPRYPMMMRPRAVARGMANALYARRHVVVMDWRWRVVTALWRVIPNALWRMMKVG